MRPIIIKIWGAVILLLVSSHAHAEAEAEPEPEAEASLGLLGRVISAVFPRGNSGDTLDSHKQPEVVVTSSGYGAPVSYHAPTNSYGPPPVDSYGAPSYAAPAPAPAPVS